MEKFLKNKRYIFIIVCLWILLCRGQVWAQEMNTSISSRPSKVNLLDAVSPSANQVTIRWKKAQNVTHYHIFCLYHGKWTRIAAVNQTKSSYTHVNSKNFPVYAGTKQTYTVRGYNYQTKQWGDYEKKGVTAQVVPGKTVLSQITAYSNNVNISWEKTVGATSYRIYYRTPNTKWVGIASVSGTTDSFKHISSKACPLSAGNIYYYTVRAYNNICKKFGDYDTKGLQTCMMPAAPTLSSIKNSAGAVTLNWKKVNGATHYIIYYRTEKETWKKIAIVSGNGTVSYTHKATSQFPLQFGKTYYYMVRGYNHSYKQYGLYNKTGWKIKITSAPQESTGKPTIKKLLQAALKPVGRTMYVWGGGWNEADTGAGTEARTIGVSPQWERFFKEQDSNYNSANTEYQIHNGLDCSGYIGWCIYNTLNTTNGKEGYVLNAGLMAQHFSNLGWGAYKPAGSVTNFCAGDIMSRSGHVYLVVGSCSDGSLVLLQSSPPGVQISGTETPGGNRNSQVAALAQKYMKTYYPAWCAKYALIYPGNHYLTDFSQMHWYTSGSSVLTDPEGYQKKNAEQVLQDLFA